LSAAPSAAVLETSFVALSGIAAKGEDTLPIVVVISQARVSTIDRPTTKEKKGNGRKRTETNKHKEQENASARRSEEDEEDSEEERRSPLRRVVGRGDLPIDFAS
jgi:hypothetical protein